MEQEAFKDLSGMQGWYRYFDDCGDEWMVECNDFTYNFYRDENNTLIFQGVLRRTTRRERGGIKYRHNAFLELQCCTC